MIRFFDFFLSLIAIIILSPLILSIIFLLKITGEGEIFFFQERVGMNNKVFKLYKFATMLKNSPLIGSGEVTIKNDPRVLPFGKFLRMTKINELPQLVNVIKGQMSLIGPRPQTRRCFEAFPSDIQNILIKMKPGLSGIGPILTRSEDQMLQSSENVINLYDNELAPYKGKIEVWYLDKQRISIYFILIFFTMWIIFFPKSNLLWKTFRDLPAPPDNLKKAFNYPF